MRGKDHRKIGMALAAALFLASASTATFAAGGGGGGGAGRGEPGRRRRRRCGRRCSGYWRYRWARPGRWALPEPVLRRRIRRDRPIRPPTPIHPAPPIRLLIPIKSIKRAAVLAVAGQEQVRQPPATQPTRLLRIPWPRRPATEVRQPTRAAPPAAKPEVCRPFFLTFHRRRVQVTEMITAQL